MTTTLDDQTCNGCGCPLSPWEWRLCPECIGREAEALRRRWIEDNQ